MSWIRRETEKGTVQYICPRCHDYHEFREDFGERTFSENYIFCRRCGARNGTGNAPTLTQPNEPLTLEQLRQMDGRPVWIVEHPDWGHWELSADAEDYIADRDQDLYGLKHDDPAGQCGLHVLGWLAYRRPPEGKT